MQVAGQVAVEGVMRSRRYSASGAALHHGPASAPPNTRLKLAAPFCCGNLLFVKSSSRRRSLSATR